jgi:soluble lytic murein transglycosylase-like protein
MMLKMNLLSSAPMFAIMAAVALAPPLFARESVCLNTGFCMTADSHTLEGALYVLRIGAGTLQFPASQIAEITALPDLPKNPPAITHTKHPPVYSAAAFEDMLVQAAIQQGLEPEFVRSVARIESNLRQDAVSNKGAIGLMQLMPDTAAVLGVDAHDAAANILGGARFLRELLLKYNGDPALALAAYNAGPGAVQKYNGVPPYLETRKYIIRVLQEYKMLLDTKAKLSLNRTIATN